ncbi:hypothetical protein E2562_037863 [Oryza meyeriana var. granulata]|uniref:Uncharacterized protein n=1 Tax=Oryza meyeriana var. granulata TaxID=110450 RepID=A0A6G1C0X4_9ORYZ|nr:hypothetical protein E2562_037863 [Oryza meyeriana var. granulata]
MSILQWQSAFPRLRPIEKPTTITSAAATCHLPFLVGFREEAPPLQSPSSLSSRNVGIQCFPPTVVVPSSAESIDRSRHYPSARRLHTRPPSSPASPDTRCHLLPCHTLQASGKTHRCRHHNPN